MSSYGRNFSTRLFIQAAFTGLLAPAGSRGSTWLMATFAIAAGAAVVGAVVRGCHDRTRELVIGFEVAAVAVGGIGLAGGHYIPGTIVGIAALITAVNHPMPRAVPVPVSVPAQAEAAPAPQFAEPQFAEPQFAAPAAAFAEPVPATVEPEVTPAPFTGVRAMNILPGQ
jgi:hypothetical protein